jgi:hypothetical protein
MIKKFEDALDVRPQDDGTNWLVLEDFCYDTDVELTPKMGYTRFPHDHPWVESWAKGWRICIPKGFITDFASIPRALWGVVGGPADGKYRKAAVVHDGLYRTLGLVTRPQADAVLLEAMKVSGCSWWERTVIYSGVRVGGSTSYKGGL